MIACDPTWKPWKESGTVYGTSAAAANHVAKTFGYVPVALVTHLDVFFVRQDGLRDACDNVDKLPTFETLAKDLVGQSAHLYCNRDSDAQRLVDVPQYLQGKEHEARLKAQETVNEINRVRKERGLRSFCDESTKYNERPALSRKERRRQRFGLLCA